MKNNFFPYLATAAFTSFITILIVVVGISYSRRHGRTPIDMAQMQQLRENASNEAAMK
ncbi:MAG: hypothetical protein WC222_04070 [Parachlamydiales bacterium]